MNVDGIKSFNEKCYALIMHIPAGRVTSYKELAHALGTKAYRAVGQAMNRNPNFITVPCHRVVKNNGEIGGYASGLPAKIELLKNEGVEVDGQRIIDFSKVFYRYSTKS